MVALGKGLGSLIPNKKETNNKLSDVGILNDGNLSTNKIYSVDINKIKANPWQPRTHFDREKLDDLAKSIKQHGILQPLVVSQNGNEYQLIAGERRLKAAKLLEMERVPVIVKDVSDRDKLELSIIENIQRDDLDPLETANSYKRLMEEFSLNQEQIAKELGKSISTIANTLRLLKLPKEIKDALQEEKISFSHAKIILGYPTKTEQLTIFKKIIKQGLTIEKLNEISKSLKKKNKKNESQDPVLASWEEKLNKSLGTKTHIHKRGEKGYIKIDFFSHEDLKNILDKLQ